MRPIKFRCWDSATGEVSEPFDVKEDWGDYLIDFKDYSTDGALDSIIWEQFTGLLDRNGKEIYEGDIVKISNLKPIFEVKYSTPFAEFLMEANGELYEEFQYWKEEEAIEVIGNIHEPPKDFRPEHLKRMGVSISKGGKE